MKEIKLDDFLLEQINLKNKDHLLMIKQFEFDNIVRKYNYPHSGSFYNLIVNNGYSSTIFNNFYVIKYKEKIIGYLEIEKTKEVYFNYALLQKERGKGLGPKLLKQLSDYLLNNYSDYMDSVNIIVDNKNKASISATLKSGFDFVEESNGFSTFTHRK